MSYTINLTNGTALIPGGLSDGTIDGPGGSTAHSSLTLIGKNYAGYGQFLNDNFVHLLENFANSSNPPNPLAGQLWWDTTNNILKVYSGTSWRISTGATSQTAQPTDVSALGGDLWFDTVNQQLKIWNGTGTWVVIGPPSVNQTIPSNFTGATPTTITDTGGGTNPVVAIIITGTIYAIIAKSTFSTTTPGFTSIKPGINFNTTVTLGLSTQDVNATNSTLVQRSSSGGINATTGSFTGTLTTAAINASGTIAGTFSGQLTGNVNAVTVNSTTVSAQGVSASSGFTGTILTASQPNITTLGNVTNLQLNGTAFLNGVALATQGGSASFSSINSTPVGNATPSTGGFTTLTISQNIIPVANLVSNIGSPTNWFNNIYGTAIHAQYADLAERFESDAEYEPGTVVEIGGPAEITAVTEDLSDNVFGVISTKAAYLMNSGAGSNSTHPPIAVQGRVPVKVTGIIHKGDRLVSAGNGLARAGKKTEISTWNVIGRALENKTDSGEGVIEAVVKLNS